MAPTRRAVESMVVVIATGYLAVFPRYDAPRQQSNMTPDEFRALALALPDAVESEHMHHPDFRVGGKIFATLGPGEVWGMVKLNLEQQAAYVLAEPRAFEAVKGGWGARGATLVRLEKARKASVAKALRDAWNNIVS